MKHTPIISFVASLLCPILICSAQSPEKPIHYRLKTSQIQIAEFTLNAGETRPLEVPAEKPVWIGFKTDLTLEASKEVSKTNKRFTWPELKQQNGPSGCGGSFGAATRFTPENGKVSLLARNPLNQSVSLLIYTDPTQ